ncbi:probable transcription factor At5g61620 isoform X2 [Cicer arietinum]|uniref:Probable transcription factor At5g61620 isoform X2 n=1 Tax=Cicer arietinum TaxID=3827 RepID=A0A3Q7YB79_CICAR|nr:probable transcription factor At5g61620 isoform X2 [Cicer arietinum]
MRIARKCSYCGTLGHNSRTCNNSMSHKQLDFYSSSTSYLGTKRSFNMDSMLSSQTSLAISSSLPTLFGANENSDKYLGSCVISTIRDGMAWTEEENKLFVRGLEKLGKGKWRDISKEFVTTKTPTQVASHAQKYFLRLYQNSFLLNRTNHPSSLLNVECEARFKAFSEPSEAFLCYPHSVLKWSSSSSSTNCTSQNEVLDLELRLGTPTPLAS